MRPILRDAILDAIHENGALRGSPSEFASAFESTEEEAAQCLTTLIKEGFLHRATGLGSSRSVYSLTAEVVSAPTYQAAIAHKSAYLSRDALP